MTKMTVQAAEAFGKTLLDNARKEDSAEKVLSRIMEIDGNSGAKEIIQDYYDEEAANDPGGFAGISEPNSQKLIELISNAIELSSPSSPMSIISIKFEDGSSISWGPGLYGSDKNPNKGK